MKTKITATIQGHFTLTLSESEARALDALAGYGADPFLKVFYQHMGRAYMQPHEAGLRSLFASIGGLSTGLSQTNKARRVFAGQEAAPTAEELPPPAWCKPTLWQRLTGVFK